MKLKNRQNKSTIIEIKIMGGSGEEEDPLKRLERRIREFSIGMTMLYTFVGNTGYKIIKVSQKLSTWGCQGGSVG